jgi:hypothetical protein
MKKNMVRDFIIANHTLMTDEALALEITKKGYTITKTAVAARRRRLHLPAFKPQVELDVQHEVKLNKVKLKKNETDKKYRILLKQNHKLEKEKAAILMITKGINTFSIKSHGNRGTSEAVAFMVASDWHVEEPVFADQVNDFNEFNLVIAKKRAEKFFANGHRLIKNSQKDTHIDTVVLPLLGDFISNSIHEELAESNLLLPIEATLFAQNLIASGIEHLLSDKSIEKLIVPCTSGNHGRTTAKRRISTEQGNSLENYMYHSLKNHFKEDPRVQFIISKGYHIYLDIFGRTVRLHHGHAFRGGINNVGGITIPVNKKIARWDIAKKADFDIFGHYHQLMSTDKWVCNGSLIGYNDFAIEIGASPEPPRQAFFLVDRERGKSVFIPIWVDDVNPLIE